MKNFVLTNADFFNMCVCKKLSDIFFQLLGAHTLFVTHNTYMYTQLLIHAFATLAVL